MPREITKYLCEFKCGCRSKSTLQQIKAHEKTCFKNPERKTCTTCKFELYEKESDYIYDPFSLKEWMNRSCSHEKGSSEFDELFERCDYHTKPMFHVQPIFNCPYWEQKTS